MISNKKVYAIILVRGGSERLPGKNLKEICGLSLIQHAIYKCKLSKYIDEIVISTEDKKIQDHVKYQHVISLPRPSRLSQKDVPNLDVLKHVVGKLSLSPDDYVVHIDVCKPLSKVEQIDEIIEYAFTNNMDTVFTCKPVKINFIHEPATPTPLINERFIFFNNARLFRVGSLRQAEIGTWGQGERHKDLPNVKPWEVDIDYIHDFIQAEALMEAGY